MREGIDFPQRRKGAEEAQRTQRVEEMFFSPETSSQLIDSSSEHCGIGLRPVHPSAARTALVGRASACQSERSSDSTSSAPPLAPRAPGFPTHSTTTPSWHELCAYLCASASLR